MKHQNKFAEHLKALRKARGKSQREMALALGISDVSYGSWERGQTEPSLDRLMAVCRLFGTSADSLLGLEALAKPVDAKALRAKSEKAKSAIAELFALIGQLPD